MFTFFFACMFIYGVHVSVYILSYMWENVCECMWSSDIDIGMIPISIDCSTLLIEAGCLCKIQNMVS